MEVVSLKKKATPILGRHLPKTAIAWLLSLVMVLGLFAGVAPMPASAAEVHSTGYTYGVDKDTFDARFEKILSSVYMGEYPTGHMQGFAIDDEMKYIYASFTTKLAKVDIETGEVVGVVHNWSGHLGDMAYYDGRVYGSLEYKGANSFYIAVFDCDKIVGDVDHTECMRTMYLPEVSKDYGATVDGEKYAYGCSGIDGVAFGTIPGDTSGEIVMMVAYGIFTDNATNINDRDYQVLLQYDLSSFLESDGNGGTKLKDDRNDILNQSNHHKKGPEHEDKYFIYTGNTNYGIQNLEYDRVSGNYCMAVYVGSCPEFPNYKIFYMDGSSTPVVQDLIMAPERFEAYKALPNSNPGCTHMAQGKVVQLANNNGSSTGEATLAYKDCDPGFGEQTYRVWGSDSIPRTPSTGLDHIYGDYFYISQSGGGLTGGQIGYAHLYKYDRDTDTFTAIVREVPAPAAKELLSYSMDKADLYTQNGVTYMKNGTSNGYDAVVEGTSSSVGVDGTANSSLSFNGWNYPANPDQLYLDDATIEYLNKEINKAGYSYSYSFWAKVASANNSDGNFVPYAGFYREDGTYVGVFEQRWRNSLKYVVNGIGTAGPGSTNAGTDWAKTIGNPTVGNPGDSPGDYITSPVNGAWNFYTVTEHNGSVVIYENGAQKLSFSVTKNHLSAEPIADFIIGGPSAKLWLDMNNRGRLIGSVDDVTIYSGVLTAAQVAENYKKFTTKETSGVPNVTAPDAAEAPSSSIFYLTYDLTADKGKDLVKDMGFNVEGIEIPGLIKGTDYTVSGNTLTIKADWLSKQECGIISKTVSNLTVKLTITNVKVPVLSFALSSDKVSNGVVTDSSVYGVNGIANNITTFNAGHSGLKNTAAFFNGHNYKDPTYIKLSTDDAAWLNSVLQKGYTINFWAKAQAENGNKMVFSGLYAANARPLGVVETNDGDGTNAAIDGILTVQANASRTGSNDMQAAKAAGVAEVGEWAMYTMSYDKATGYLKLYVNGTLVASTPVADDIIGQISQLFIGHQYKKYYSASGNRDWTTRGGFYGLMDSFEVYNYALSDEEINVLAGGGAIQPAIKTPPVVHWTMDASTLNGDGTMTDSSTNGLISYFQNVTPTTGVDGKEGGALYFDGSADAGDFSRVWLSTEGIASLNAAVGDKLTVAFWMKPDFASQGENYPYTGTWTPVGGVFGESDHRFLMVSEFRYGQMTYCAQSGGDKHIAGLSASGWKDDQWYYVVMTYDGSTTETLSSKDNSYHRLFIVTPDGTVNEYTGGRPFVNANLLNKLTALEFGGQYAKGHWTDTNVRGRYIGAIDDIKVYNIAVTKDDVTKLYISKPVTGTKLSLSEHEFEVKLSAPADVTVQVKNAASLTSVSGLTSSDWSFSDGTLVIKASALQVGVNELKLTFDTGVKTISVNVIDDRTFFTGSIVFDKASPADLTFTADFGASVKTVSADRLSANDYTINGKTVTVKADWLSAQQPGAVEITVTADTDEIHVFTIHVLNTTAADDGNTEPPYPILYFPMDKGGLTTSTHANGNVSGTLADASGNGIDLQVGGLTSAAAGKDGTANGTIFFDSYRDFDISYGHLDENGMNFLKAAASEAITFSFWHKSDRISANYMPIMGLYGGDGRPLLLAEFYAGTGGERGGKNQTTTPTLTATPEGSTSLATGFVRAPSAVTMNSTWHHYAVTYNNTTGAAILYVDGTQAATATFTPGLIDRADTFIIGALDNADYYAVGGSSSRTEGMAINSHGRLHGYLDEVKVYGSVLTAAQIKALAEDTSFGLPFDTTGIRELTVTADKVDTVYAPGTANVGYTNLSAVITGSDIPVQVEGYTFSYVGTGTTVYGPTAEAPVNAGTYKVTITVDDTLYTGEATVEFAIAKADPVCNVPTGLTATYGDALSTVTLTNPTGNTAGTWAWVDSSALVGDAGENTHSVQFTPADTANYNTPAPATAIVTVAKAAQTAPEAPAGGYTAESYNADTFTFTIASPVTDGYYEYSTDGQTWQDSPVFEGMIPESTVTFYTRIKEQANYLASPASEGTEVFFAKLDRTDSPALEITVSGYAVDRVITVTPVDKAEYSFDGGLTWTTENTKSGFDGTTDNEVEVAIRWAETATYNPGPANGSSVNVKKPVQTVEIEIDEQTATYGDAPLTAPAVTALGEITWTSSDPSIASVDPVTGEVTILKAGTVTITATAAETDVYAEGSASYTLTIAKKVITVSALNRQIMITQALPDFTDPTIGVDYVVDGMLEGDSIVVYLSTDADIYRAGLYTITITAAVSDKYDFVLVNGSLTVVAGSTGDSGNIGGGDIGSGSGGSSSGGYFPAPGIECKCEQFTDIDTGLWYHNAICYVVDKGIMNGTGDGTAFSPWLNLSRAMMMTMLARLDGVDTTTGSTWYEAGMEWAMDKGISDGTNPHGEITREQMVTMLYRFAGKPATAGNLILGFKDADQVSDWAKDAMNWAVTCGIIQGGGDGYLNPQGTATRAEVAQILYNYLVL